MQIAKMLKQLQRKLVMPDFYPVVRNNKHNWCYRFVYWNVDKPNIIMYETETNKGFQVAENHAIGNMHFDGCNQLKYLGKSLVKGG